MVYFAAAEEPGVEAVLGINLAFYNELKPGDKSARIAAAVLTAVLPDGDVTADRIVGHLDTPFPLSTDYVPEYKD
jgi:hypothetical protein